MKTKDILDAWSTDKEHLFFHQRFQSSTPTPCEVIGFHTEPAVTDGPRYARRPERKTVEVRMFHNLAHMRPRRDENGEIAKPEGTIVRVPTREIHPCPWTTWTEYGESMERHHDAKEARAVARQDLVRGVREIAEALGIQLTIGQTQFGKDYISGDLSSLVATLRDAKRYYETLATEEAV